MDRSDAIEAGMRIRARIEADRRARGIPAEGFLFPGERPEIVYPRTAVSEKDES